MTSLCPVCGSPTACGCRVRCWCGWHYVFGQACSNPCHEEERAAERRARFVAEMSGPANEIAPAKAPLPDPVERVPAPRSVQATERAARRLPSHRTGAQKRADVLGLLGKGLSDREIARQARVSPSTVSAVRKAAS